MIESLRDLIAYQEWADSQFYKTCGSVPEAHQDQTLLTLQTHITFVQASFLKVLRGEEFKLPPENAPIPSMEELRLLARNNHLSLTAFVSELDGESVTRTVRIPWFPDPPCELTVWQALIQIAMHTQHHRAQNMARLRALGGSRLVIDWIVWIWKGKPQAEWD